MARETMYRQPLELYLLGKISEHAAMDIKSVHVRPVQGDPRNCNWEVDWVDPPLTAEMMSDLNRLILAPVRETINLVE